jgi:acyl dehydratase
MPIAYPAILDLREENQSMRWDDRDVMLYALAIGMGGPPAELPFVYEKNLRVMPTFLTVAAWGKRPLRRSGINYLRMLHASQTMTWHAPVPVDGRVIVDSRISDVFDKGPDHGALIVTETLVREEKSGELISSYYASILARADGGFGGPRDGAPEGHAVPDRAPDVSLDYQTKGNQALLYRLCCDRNPMHADPAVAAKGGFQQPVLHGLCTYGMACRAVLATYADYDTNRIRSHDARFAAPVFPGDVVTFDLWRDGAIISFEGRVKARNAKVITNGKTVLR